MSYRSVEGVYEKIDDYLYEPMDEKPVQEQQENTPVVGGSVDDKVITSCPAYENSTSFTATGISVLYLTLILDVTLSYPPYFFTKERVKNKRMMNMRMFKNCV